MAGLNSTGQRVQMSPLIFETVHMRPGRQKRVKGSALRGLEHMRDGTLRGTMQFYNVTETWYRYPRMAHSRSKALSGSIDLRACRVAWESVNVRCRVKMKNASWSHTSRGLGWPTLSPERKNTGQMCKQGF
jgi:hypothetical protein